MADENSVVPANILQSEFKLKPRVHFTLPSECSASTGTKSPRHQGLFVPYPNISSVSHSVPPPSGLDGLKETPALYIETETMKEDDKETLYYNIVDAFGRQLYLAQETSIRHGSSRPFSMKLLDPGGKTVLNLQRQESGKLCFFGARYRANHLTVHSGNGEKLLGQVRQLPGPILHFNILDEYGELIMKVMGPAKKISCIKCHSFCCGPKILKKEKVQLMYLESTRDGTDIYPIGCFNVISVGKANGDKSVGGSVFGLQFPLEMSCEYKALVLGAGVLIDFTYWDIKASRCLNWYGSGLVILCVACISSTVSLIIICVILWYFLYYHHHQFPS